MKRIGKDEVLEFIYRLVSFSCIRARVRQAMKSKESSEAIRVHREVKERKAAYRKKVREEQIRQESGIGG